MRILYFADIRFPLERANGIQTMQTCWALADRGHSVRLVVRPDTTTPPRDPFAFYGLPPAPSLEIRRVRPAGSALPRRAWYLAAAVARAVAWRACDVILTRDLGVAAALVGVPRSVRPPVVYESHGFAPEVARALPEMLTGASPPSSAKLDRLTRREGLVWRRAEGCVTITSGLRQEYASRFGARPCVAVVPDGVRLPPDRRFRPAAPAAVPVVAYAGHLYPWKGAEVVIEAIARLPGVRGLLIGGHPAEPDLARLSSFASDTGVGSRVTLTGPVEPPKVAVLLEAAHVLVLPNPASRVSNCYTSPLKLFDYLAAGRPIVASDLAAIREVLRHEENALLVSAGDAADTAAAIKRLLDDRALADRLARQAFADASLYTWERRAERLERLLIEAAGRNAGGPVP